MKLNKINQLLKKYDKRYEKLHKNSNDLTKLFTYNWDDPLFVKLERLNREINKKIISNIAREDILLLKREEIYARNNK